MATLESKWIVAISSLTDLTQRGELQWQGMQQTLGDMFAEKPDEVRSRGLLATTAYKAKYKDKWFKLTFYSGVAQLGGLRVKSGSGVFSLQIIGDDGNVVFNVPENTGLEDLYKAIQYRLSGVDDILESLLKEKSGRI